MPSLATDKAFPELGGSAGGTSIQGATRRLDFPASDPNALLFRLSKQIRIEIGEVQGQVTARLTLQANDETVAGQMAAVAQGLVALGRLANKPELTKLLEAVSVKQAGASVVATLSLPAAEVVNMLKADAERKAARKAQEK